MSLKIAVVGCGHLGSIHARVLGGIPGVSVVAVADIEPAKESVAKEAGAEFYTDYQKIPDDIEAVVIAVPTTFHLEAALHFIERGVPCLVEKPLASSVEDAERLAEKADSRGVVLQVGHVERFNPALRAVEKWIDNPRFIDAVRISPYPFRGTDVGVIMDMMIHDIDIILHLVDRPISEVRASAVAVLSRSEDLANARLEFEGGCVADVTASRVAIRKERKLRIFQNDAYMSLDLLTRKADVYRKREKLLSGEIDPGELTPEKLGGEDPLSFALQHLIEIARPEVNAEANPLEEELKHFIECVKTGSEPLVTARHGVQAIAVAEEVRRAVGGI